MYYPNTLHNKKELTKYISGFLKTDSSANYAIENALCNFSTMVPIRTRPIRNDLFKLNHSPIYNVRLTIGNGPIVKSGIRWEDAFTHLNHDDDDCFHEVPVYNKKSLLRYNLNYLNRRGDEF